MGGATERRGRSVWARDGEEERVAGAGERRSEGGDGDGLLEGGGGGLKWFRGAIV